MGAFGSDPKNVQRKIKQPVVDWGNYDGDPDSIGQIYKRQQAEMQENNKVDIILDDSGYYSCK